MAKIRLFSFADITGRDWAPQLATRSLSIRAPSTWSQKQPAAPARYSHPRRRRYSRRTTVNAPPPPTHHRRRRPCTIRWLTRTGSRRPYSHGACPSNWARRRTCSWRLPPWHRWPRAPRPSRSSGFIRITIRTILTIIRIIWTRTQSRPNRCSRPRRRRRRHSIPTIWPATRPPRRPRP